MSGETIRPSQATIVRVFQEGDHWAIDAADDEGNYTDEIWTDYANKSFSSCKEAMYCTREFMQVYNLTHLRIMIIDNDNNPRPAVRHPTMRRSRQEDLILYGLDDCKLTVYRDNMGEPFREGCRLTFQDQEENISVLLSDRDVARLIEFLQKQIAGTPNDGKKANNSGHRS